MLLPPRSVYKIYASIEMKVKLGSCNADWSRQFNELRVESLVKLAANEYNDAREKCSRIIVGNEFIKTLF